ncbi:MAG: alpha/beta hydrolase [Gammaproteobacteria bacterium]
MTGSLRKTLARAALRVVSRPMTQAGVPLKLQRLALDNAALGMRSPRGLSVEPARPGGLPGTRVTPVAAGDHHILYLHGGAYISGGSRSHVPIAGQLANAAGATAWLIDYRLAPEFPYPAAVDDALAAYRGLLDMKIPAAKIAIAGDSAGGGLSLATTLAIRDAGLPLPAALALLSPWTDLTLSGESMQSKIAVDPMLGPLWLEWAAGMYAEGTLRTAPGVSPLFADLGGFPPLLVHVGSDEVLLDDSTFLARRAADAGVDVTLRVFDGLWHVFQAQAGMIDEADESVGEIGNFIRARCGG